MRLLLDQNLSPRLGRSLTASTGWAVSGVRELGLEDATDHAIWSFARAEGWVIVTNDADFVDLAILRGAPPKIVLLRYGNATTTEHSAAILGHRERLLAFVSDEDTVVLELRSRRGTT